MGTVQAGFDRVARPQIRDALLHYTRGGPRIFELEQIATRAAAEPVVAAAAMAELEQEESFVVERAHKTEPQWWVA